MIEKEEDVLLGVPPAWCSKACRNSLTEVCMEHCAIKRDGSWFDPRDDIEIMDLPRFPLKEFVQEMGPKERTLAIGLYTSLMVDQAQGREVQHGRTFKGRRRHAHYAALASPKLPPDAETGPHQNGQVGETAAGDAGGVAEGADGDPQDVS